MPPPIPTVGKILREHEKKRKIMPTRYLLQNYFATVSAIKPLFLMSPLSVATYLGPDAQFDLVVFDEASQIFPEDALGAIYRAKQAIIVGDEHQLPPTSFFLASDVSENDEDDYSENDNDYESILELASGTLPSKRLLWHYRSKSESLIAFSNEEIYDSSLLSFPNATHRPEDGVHLHYCPEGRYLRKSRTNPVEAQAVTALLFHLAKA
jgi:superfamily I DNA and/or RNA helicase